MCKGTLAVAMMAMAGVTQAEDWVDIGAGSGSFPGIFRYENFDPEISPTGRIPRLPRVGWDTDFRPMVVFNSRKAGGLIPSQTAVAASWVGGQWIPAQGTEDALALPGFNVTLPYPVAMASDLNALVVAAPGVASQGVASNLHVSFHDPTAGFTGIGNSLASGGLTSVTTTSRMVRDVAVALNSDSEPFIAYSFGGEGAQGQRDIYLQRLDEDTWTGVGGSDTTPIAESSGVFVTNYLPTVGFLDGQPVVAWTERNSEIDRVRARRYDSAEDAWVNLPNLARQSFVEFGRHPQIVTPDDDSLFYFSYEDLPSATLKVLQWDADAGELVDLGDPMAPWGVDEFAPLPNNDLTEYIPASHAITVDLRGQPIVAFRGASPDDDNTFHIYVSYLGNNGQWEALGDPASSLGASSYAYDPGSGEPPLGHYGPSLFVGLNNQPMLAWEFDGGASLGSVVLLRQYGEQTSPAGPSQLQARALVVSSMLGFITTTKVQNYYIDENEDGILDPADVVLFSPDPVKVGRKD